MKLLSIKPNNLNINSVTFLNLGTIITVDFEIEFDTF